LHGIFSGGNSFARLRGKEAAAYRNARAVSNPAASGQRLFREAEAKALGEVKKSVRHGCHANGALHNCHDLPYIGAWEDQPGA
jgi:hypothetical protein